MSNESPELTERQLRVLQLSADGFECSDAAKELGLTLYIVRKIRSKLLANLGADTMEQAVAMAIRRKIIE